MLPSSILFLGFWEKPCHVVGEFLDKKKRAHDVQEKMVDESLKLEWEKMAKSNI